MKKQTAILALALSCALAAPAFASFTTTSTVQSEQLAKGGSKKPRKAKTPKAPKQA